MKQLKDAMQHEEHDFSKERPEFDQSENDRDKDFPEKVLGAKKVSQYGYKIARYFIARYASKSVLLKELSFLL